MTTFRNAIIAQVEAMKEAKRLVFEGTGHTCYAMIKMGDPNTNQIPSYESHLVKDVLAQTFKQVYTSWILEGRIKDCIMTRRFMAGTNLEY